MNPERRKALLSDLYKLQAELPALIAGVANNNERICQDALALIQGASRQRFDVALDKLTTYVLDEAKKGNKQPLREIASGRAFE